MSTSAKCLMQLDFLASGCYFQTKKHAKVSISPFVLPLSYYKPLMIFLSEGPSRG
jgi:hypothetical protein